MTLFIFKQAVITWKLYHKGSCNRRLYVL